MRTIVVACFSIALCGTHLAAIRQAAAQSALDRTVLPLAQPQPPTIAEIDARDADPPPRFEVKAPAGAPNVVIVNQAFAEKYWPGENPLGKRMTFDRREEKENPDWSSVIAVVGDTRPRSLDASPQPTVYFSYQQFSLPFMAVVVRGTQDTAAVAQAIRTHLRSLDPNLPVEEVRTLADSASSRPSTSARTGPPAGSYVAGLLAKGEWRNDRYDTRSTGGEFVRQDSAFRNWVTRDGAPGPTGTGGFPAEGGRYHVYVSLACPWAHRTLILRALKGLEEVISVSVVHPHMLDNGWEFRDCDAGGFETGDPLYGQRYLWELYVRAGPEYSGRVTVPVLWDKERRTIVNNESAEIIRMLNGAFDGVGANHNDYYPEELRAEIDEQNAFIYPNVNNGVYRAGFATTQEAYEEAAKALFAALERRLAPQRLAQPRGPTHPMHRRGILHRAGHIARVVQGDQGRPARARVVHDEERLPGDRPLEHPADAAPGGGVHLHVPRHPGHPAGLHRGPEGDPARDLLRRAEQRVHLREDDRKRGRLPGGGGQRLYHLRGERRHPDRLRLAEGPLRGPLRHHPDPAEREPPGGEPDPDAPADRRAGPEDRPVPPVRDRPVPGPDDLGGGSAGPGPAGTDREG